MLLHIKTGLVCLTNVFPQENRHTSVHDRSAIRYIRFCHTVLKRHALKG